VEVNKVYRVDRGDGVEVNKVNLVYWGDRVEVNKVNIVYRVDRVEVNKVIKVYRVDRVYRVGRVDGGSLDGLVMVNLSGKVNLDTKTGKIKVVNCSHEEKIQCQTKSPNCTGNTERRAINNPDSIRI